MFQITEQVIAKHLAETLCEFGGEGEDCENCHVPIPPGDPVHFFSGGGYESRDGTYVCKACAVNLIRGE